MIYFCFILPLPHFSSKSTLNRFPLHYSIQTSFYQQWVAYFTMKWAIIICHQDASIWQSRLLLFEIFPSHGLRDSTYNYFLSLFYFLFTFPLLRLFFYTKPIGKKIIDQHSQSLNESSPNNRLGSRYIFMWGMLSLGNNRKYI